MQDSRTLYRFGPYELDPMARSLLKDSKRLVLPDRQFDVLTCLVMNAGRIVHKDDLHRAAWGRVDTVGDGSIVMAVKGVRDALGVRPDRQPYIDTVVRRGYRFFAPLERIEWKEPEILPETLAGQHEAFVDGRAALETFNLDEVAHARAAFERALDLNPELAAAHKGMATACFLAFEATRATLQPDVEQLRIARRHALEARRLDPKCNHAWGTLALVCHRIGDVREALVAARTALSFDHADWMDHLRLGAVSWGHERLRAAQQALSRHWRLALAHWFAATVFVARGAFDYALHDLRGGRALQDEQRGGGGRYTAVGLHWLHGLVLAAKGDVDGGIAELERELAITDPHHVYGRESIANSHYAIGALRMRQCRQDDAVAAFRRALDVLPGHAAAIAALPTSSQDLFGNPAQEPMATAIGLVTQQKHEEAALVVKHALAHAAPGSALWLLPVEPTLHVIARPDVWATALGTLADRAV